MAQVTDIAAAGVLAYLIAATLAEVFLFYLLRSTGIVYVGIGIVAVTKAVLIASYFMELKYEPRPLRILTLLAAAFLTLMIIVMIFSFPHA